MNFFDDYDKAKSYLIQTIKKNLYAKDQLIFDKLDFYDDDIYLDPFIIASLHNANENYLDFLVNCYSDNIKTFEIVLDEQNKIYIPNSGVYVFNSTNKKLLIRKKANSYIFFDILEKDKIIPFVFSPISINKFGIEVLNYLHPIIERQFKGQLNIVDDDRYNNYIDKALGVIKISYPKFFDLIINMVKKIVIYFGDDNSFASIETQGVIYLNVRDEKSNEVFFIDDILHQSAHVIFNTLTLKSKKDFFLMPHDSPFSEFTNDKRDTGDLYSRFHGLFTQSNINTCLTNCLIENTFKGKKKIEVIGRIVDNMTMFKGMIFKFEKKEHYKEEGFNWFSFFLNKYHELYEYNKSFIMEYDVSNQSYVFNFDLFLKTNLNKLKQKNLL